MLKGLRRLVRLPRSPLRYIREQVEREERDRLIAQFAAVGEAQHNFSSLMCRHPARHALSWASADPLEQLWNLPARSVDRRSPGQRPG